MKNVEWRKAVNQSVGPAKITNIDNFFLRITPNFTSPIDTFYNNTQELIKIAQPDFLKMSPRLGSLFLIGLVSSTENYFRDLFAKMLKICRTSQAKSAENTIKLGSVIWHGNIEVERGAFENTSFASAEEIRKTVKNFLDIELEKNGPTNTILAEFDKVCELRHGIVHCDSIISGKNALKLKLLPSSARIQIQIGYPQFQECALICNTLVVSFNAEVFERFARRWAYDWSKLPYWDATVEKSLFKEIWDSFYSKIDNVANRITPNITMAKCRNAIKKEFKRS